jgi:hypothetical protein
MLFEKTPPTDPSAKSRSDLIMRIVLWIAQILLALIFLLSAGLKTFAFHMMSARTPNISNLHGLFLIISIFEVAGAVGLILPILTGIYPILTAWAATGLATIAIIAGAFHVMRGETGELTGVAVMVLLAAFIIWGRGFRTSRHAPAIG